MRKFILLLSLFMVVHFGFGQQNSKSAYQTVSFHTTDGIKVTADLYIANKSNAPFIILFHQAGYSRGEYREIAPKLNKMGFNCMSIDQRSGKEVNGIVNQTHLEAKKINKPTQYIDAIPDLEAAYLYVKSEIKPGKIIVWGSSYSAALMFYMGSVHYNDVSGILAFSPGEYFKINGNDIKSYAEKVSCPVFITSASNEHKQWKGIFDSVKTDKYSLLPKAEGKHGSKALWMNNVSNKEYWKAVEEFLNKVK